MRVFVSTSLAYLLCLQFAYGQVRTIVINEFMADPSPSAGLPEVEYVELLNVTGEIIFLTGWTLNEKPIPQIQIPPGGYLLLCEKSNLALFDSGIHKTGLQGWDRLNNDGQPIVLKDGSAGIRDSINYGPAWITDPQKKHGGWSLELVNPEKPCFDKNNWSVSVNLSGGTPGFNNSVYNSDPDISPPELMEFGWIAPGYLKLIFNEPVDFRIPIDPAMIFTLFPATSSFIIQNISYTDIQILKFTDVLDKGINYSLSISNLADCERNYLNDTLIYIGIGKEPFFNEILITELMIDEIPTAGLPESEYIEILNITDQVINTGNLYIYSGQNYYLIPPTQMQPGIYYLLVPENKKTLFKDYIYLIPLSRFPRLKNEGETLALFNTITGLVFSIKYEKSWYKDELRSEGGYSLELIDTNNPCGDFRNWSASLDEYGGTPGKPNSHQSKNPDLSGPRISKANIEGDSIIILEFNERLHPDCFENLTWFLNSHRFSDILKYDSVLLQMISVDIPEYLTAVDPYSFSIEGVRDCVGNPMAEDEKSILIHLPRPADYGDVVINEVLFNPRPGGVDWIELYNLSDKYINLRDWLLSNQPDNTSKKRFPLAEETLLIGPYEFMVFTRDPVRLLVDFPTAQRDKIVLVREMPDMPDSKGYISVWSSDSSVMDEMNYEKDYHSQFLKNQDGVSLERLSPEKPADDPMNWLSASSQAGHGTPTFPNSQYRADPGTGPKFVIGPSIFSPDQDGFDDILHIEVLDTYPGTISNLYVFDLEGHVVNTLGRGLLLGNHEYFKWDGLNDNGVYASPGHYIILLEMYHPDEGVSRYKHKVAIGRRY